MKTKLQLTPEQSARISTFWDSHGSYAGAMIAQPVKRKSGYVLKIRILLPGQVEHMDNLLHTFR